jgi:pyridoxamine 5'-phosphate oxidase
MNVALDPIARFQDALARAVTAFGEPLASPTRSSADPTAMTLATTDTFGAPDARIVLLKGVDARGFVFFTNRESQKGRELAANPRAALCILWPALGEQVRVLGSVDFASDEESDAYFASRPRESQIGAWASKQSSPVPSREEILAAVRATEARFAGKTVPRPRHWGGYRVVPSRIEFWKEGAYRIHDRDAYTRDESGQWRVEKLFP